MALSVAFTQSAQTISTTEYSLSNNGTTLTPRTEDGCFQLWLDTANMAAGDQYELKLYEKCVSGGTQRLVETWILDGAQSKPGTCLPVFILMEGWDFTMKRLAGSDRAFSWSIRQAS